MFPSPSDRATSANADMLTIAARSLASAPSGRSGNVAYAMSVTMRPSTESPRNSSRSFVISVPCSNAYDRCVSAAWRMSGSVNGTPRARSKASSDASTGAELTKLLDLDGLPAGVVAAVAAHPVGELGLVTLRALRVGGASLFQFAARLALRVLLCFFLGTATVFPSFLDCSVTSSGDASVPVFELVEHELEVGPAGIDLGMIPGALPEVAIAAAHAAQAQAVGTVQRRERQLQAERVADHLLGIEGPLDIERIDVLVVGLGGRREELVDLDAYRLLEVPQATGAAQRERAVEMARDEDPLDHRLQQQIAVDRLIGLERGDLRSEAFERPPTCASARPRASRSDRARRWPRSSPLVLLRVATLRSGRRRTPAPRRWDPAETVATHSTWSPAPGRGTFEPRSGSASAISNCASLAST